MSRHHASTLLRDTVAGVHFVESRALQAILAPAAGLGLQVGRVDLTGCEGRRDVLSRIAAALDFPPHFGHNWDALADCLGDLSWLPGDGVVLVLDGADALREADGEAFPTLLEILGTVASDAAARNRRWHAVIALDHRAEPSGARP